MARGADPTFLRVNSQATRIDPSSSAPACPSCGGPKPSKLPLCRHCFRRLPVPMQRKFYAVRFQPVRVARAVSEAVGWLRYEAPPEPPTLF